MIMLFTKSGYLLKLEAHTAERTLKEGFRILLKTSLYSEDEGDFHSAFFLLSIGIERLLKLALISNELLEVRYGLPKAGHLKKEFGHDIMKAHSACLTLLERRGTSPEQLSEIQKETLSFLSQFAGKSRYFHLDQIETPTKTLDPVSAWASIVRRCHYTRFSAKRINSLFHGILKKMDEENIENKYTYFLDDSGSPMLLADIEHDRLMWKMNKRHLAWLILRSLQPIQELLNMTSAEATALEIDLGMRQMAIPEYTDFFQFLLISEESHVKNSLWEH
jgi:hypothetical protein